jgi:hypothetical protein
MPLLLFWLWLVEQMGTLFVQQGALMSREVVFSTLSNDSFMVRDMAICAAHCCLSLRSIPEKGYLRFMMDHAVNMTYAGSCLKPESSDV